MSIKQVAMVNVKSVNVESSNVKSLGYDESTNTAYVEYIKSGTYRYFDVPKDVFEAWLNAESKGKYFHAHIKNKYEFEKLDDYTTVGAEDTSPANSSSLSEDEVKALTDCSVLIAGFPPQQGTAHAAGYDLVASETVTIDPGFTKIVGTGIGIAMPKDMAALVVPRSGLSAKTGLRVANAPGLIDADYRGQIGVVMHNVGSKTETINKDDRIAQLLFIRIEHPDFVPVFELPPSERGNGGFGSTGK